MIELAIVEGSTDGVWRFALVIGGITLFAALLLTILSGLLAPAAKRGGNSDDRPSPWPVAAAYLFPPLVLAFYLLTWLFAASESGAIRLVQQFAWSFPGLLLGALFFGFPIALALSRAVSRAVSSSVIDAATLDGASSWQVRRFILWPQFWREFPQIFGTIFWHVAVGFGFILLLGVESERARTSGLISIPAGFGYALVLASAAVAALLTRNRTVANRASKS